MGVLSLHNECPPLDYGPDTEDVIQGLLLGEEGTSAMLRALADCLISLAAMDDTVGAMVGGFTSYMNALNATDGPQATRPSGATGAQEVTAGSNGSSRGNSNESYAGVFKALTQTIGRINLALHKYREWSTYAQHAREAGRGKAFQAALEQTSGMDFEALVQRRIAGLNKLKVRILALQQFEETGYQMFRSYDYPGFFLLFMAPVRDLAIAAEELYSEVVRGALASEQAFSRVCRVWEGNPAGSSADGAAVYTTTPQDMLGQV